MDIKETGVCLSSVSLPYKFGGNEGTSHKIRFNVKGEIYSCNSNAEQVSRFAQYVGQTGEVTLRITSPKEVLKLQVVEFVPE